MAGGIAVMSQKTPGNGGGNQRNAAANQIRQGFVNEKQSAGKNRAENARQRAETLRDAEVRALLMR